MFVKLSSAVMCQLQLFSTPNRQQVACKTEAQSEHVHVKCTFSARFGADLRARSVLISKNFCVGAQSEAYQECVVGWEISLSLSLEALTHSLTPTHSIHACLSTLSVTGKGRPPLSLSLSLSSCSTPHHHN